MYIIQDNFKVWRGSARKISSLPRIIYKIETEQDVYLFYPVVELDERLLEIEHVCVHSFLCDRSKLGQQLLQPFPAPSTVVNLGRIWGIRVGLLALGLGSNTACLSSTQQWTTSVPWRQTLRVGCQRPCLSMCSLWGQMGWEKKLRHP
jgi:hypothetical protein